MAKMQAAGATAVLGFAMLLLGPVEAVAKSGGGWSAQPHHSFRHATTHRPFARHRGAFRGWPLVAGYLSYPPYYGPDPIGDVVIERFVSPPEPPRALSCQRSRETVTVASQDGGTREINITRC